MTRSTVSCIAAVAAIVAAPRSSPADAPATTQSATQSATAPSLRVGDPAPPLAVDRWLKGRPVTRFEPCTVYVVEFWATWCGPCVAAMPDLSWLQEKYPRVVFIGIDGEEKDAALVDPFMRDHGDTMKYRVAADASPGEYAPGPTWRGWMDAAGVGGIPCSFIVGPDGRVAKITSPHGLPRVLKLIAAGTFNPAVDDGLKKKADPLWEAYGAASTRKDYDAALGLLDQIEAVMPGSVSDYPRRATLIQKHDFAGVEAQYQAFANRVAASEVMPSDVDQAERDRLWFYSEKGDAAAINREVAAMAAKHAGDAGELNMLAWQLVGGPGWPRYRALSIDLDLVLRVAEEANAASGHADPQMLDTLARVYAVRGEFERAVEIEAVAVSHQSDVDRKAALEKILTGYREKKVE